MTSDNNNVSSTRPAGFESRLVPDLPPPYPHFTRLLTLCQVLSGGRQPTNSVMPMYWVEFSVTSTKAIFPKKKTILQNKQENSHKGRMKQVVIKSSLC